MVLVSEAAGLKHLPSLNTRPAPVQGVIRALEDHAGVSDTGADNWHRGAAAMHMWLSDKIAASKGDPLAQQLP